MKQLAHKIVGSVLMLGMVVFGFSGHAADPELTVTYEALTQSAHEGDTFETRIRLDASGQIETKKAEPVDVVVVMDVSGSMNFDAGAPSTEPPRISVAERQSRVGVSTGRVSSLFRARIEEAQDALIELMGQVDEENSRVGLVTYGQSRATVVVPLSGFNQRTFEDRVLSLQTLSNTPMGLGLQAGINELKKARGNAKKAIIFISDGHHNTGPSPDSFYNQVPSDVTVYSIGIGGDVTESFDCGYYTYYCQSGEFWLQGIATTGNQQGRYLHLPSATELSGTFTTLYNELVDPIVAQDVSVSLALRPEFSFVSSIPGPDSVVQEANGERVTWSVDQLTDGQSAEILATLRVNSRSVVQPQPINHPFPESFVEYSNALGNFQEPLSESVVLIGSGNRAPVIDSFTVSPRSGLVNDTSFTFEVTETDPDGDLLSYSWQRSGGTIVQGCGSGSTICVLRFPTTGIKSVTVTVRDPQGASAQGVQTVWVNDRVAAVVCEANTTEVDEGVQITWNSTVSNTIGPYIYTWTGDDGLVGSASSVSKVYTSAGTKHAFITVIDGASNVLQNDCSTVVNDLPIFREARP